MVEKDCEVTEKIKNTAKTVDKMGGMTKKLIEGVED